MRLLLLALLGCVVPTGVSGQNTAPADSARIERLASLGRLWGVVKHFHPAIATRRIDWDSALVAAIPRVRSATSAAEFSAAVEAMLATLNDPLTRVLATDTAGLATANQQAGVAWERDSTLIVTLGEASVGRVTEVLEAAHDDIRTAPRIVFDLRSGRERPRGRFMRLTNAFANAGTDELLTHEPLPAPARRFRRHSGFPSQDGFDYYYSAGFVSEALRESFQPATEMPAKRVVWLVDRGSDLPQIALAQAMAGEAVIVSAAATPDLPGLGLIWRMELADGVRVGIRTADAATPTGATLRATHALGVADAADSTALRSAIEWTQHAPPPQPAYDVPVFSPAPERAYADMRYPPLEYRLLAAFRFWNVIEHFSPYKDLLDEDWDAVLPWAVRRFESARDTMEYGLAVAEMVAKTQDSHGISRSLFERTALGSYVGRAAPGVRARFIENELVVVALAADSTTQASGISVGDVVTAVDGEEITARRMRLEPYLPHSTPQALDRVLADVILNGPPGTARLSIRDDRGSARVVALPRSPAFMGLDPRNWPLSGPAWKLLSDDVAYVDLRRLGHAQVDSMFDALAHTRGIIFDNRGYPSADVWAIASWLATEPNIAESRFSRPLVLSPDPSDISSIAWIQRIDPTNRPRYTGKTVLLLDERSGSLSEHTGLLFKAANGTTIVGSPTVGANGDVTNVVLPGGILANFTGQEVRWPDGRQLQRIGVMPDVLVRPTIAGIRAGRDEVLERALEIVRQQR